MTKTKAQLRAEAVERLKKINSDNSPKPWAAALGIPWNSDNVPKTMGRMKAALINLLTDEPTNVITDGTNVTASDSPLGGKSPEGDAVAILRKVAADKTDVSSDDLLCYAVGADFVPDALNTLADMVERDYVRREDYDAKCAEYSAMRDRAWGAEAERDEWKAVADALEATKRDWLDGYYLNKLTKAEAERDEYFHYAEQYEFLKRTLQRVTAERDKWKAKAEQAMESYQDAKADRDAWMAKAVRLDVDGEPCNQSYMDTDTEQQNPSSRESDSGEDVISEGQKVTCPGEQAKSKWQSNDGQVDSREKLEADIADLMVAEPLYEIALKWLDRQAAITHRETLCHPDERDEQIAELEAERDRLQNEVGIFVTAIERLGESSAKMQAELSRLRANERVRRWAR